MEWWHLKKKSNSYILGIFIGPGVNNKNYSEVLEVPSLIKAKCTPPALPIDLYNYIIVKQDSNIILCGGFISSTFSRSSECFLLASTGLWLRSPTIPSLTIVRSGAASALLSGTWWVTGGNNGTASSYISTEVRNVNGTWSRSVDLPYSMTSHCMVTINSTHVFIGGGGFWLAEPSKYVSSPHWFWLHVSRR